jgi:hypothetical protein
MEKSPYSNPAGEMKQCEKEKEDTVHALSALHVQVASPCFRRPPGFVALPLGALIRLIPSGPCERVFVKLRLLPKPEDPEEHTSPPRRWLCVCRGSRARQLIWVHLPSSAVVGMIEIVIIFPFSGPDVGDGTLLRPSQRDYITHSICLLTSSSKSGTLTVHLLTSMSIMELPHIKVPRLGSTFHLHQ